VAPSAEVAPSAKSNGLLSDDQMSELGRLPLDEIRRRAEAGEL
jgi:hypothetical protein